ncbi:hypothetical protein K7T73_12575 [Bacillus badius]|uniref:hypothetical protein n=1 Tax=Bacillus badius TaxID=1455 RepID=UPI001CBEF070|nr:hypothetical protein [Bacillus badius]UAT29435.1 hypothetical protein K7T73_12575 [Bacillus badius]
MTIITILTIGIVLIFLWRKLNGLKVFGVPEEWHPVDICYRCRYERKARLGETYFVCPNCGCVGGVVMMKRGNNYQKFLTYKPYRNFDGEWLVDLEREVHITVKSETEERYEINREVKWGIPESEADELLKDKGHTNTYTEEDGVEYTIRYSDWKKGKK